MKTSLRMLVMLAIASLAHFSQANDDVLFTLHGSNTVGARLAPQCAKAYLESIGVNHVQIASAGVENEYWIAGSRGKGLNLKPVKIKIAAHGSSTGFKGLLSGEADIAMSSRAIKDKEVKALKHLGDMRSRASEHTIAIDGLAILVHPSNPIDALTVEQIAKLFAGEITNWKELGGADKRVSIYARDDRSGTWDTFRKLVLAKTYQLSEAALRFESNDDLSDRVSMDRGAIGFAGLASVRGAKLLAVADNETQSMKPSEYTVATEDYPLARRLYMYTPAQSSTPWVREFVDFCQSQQGQDIVREVGFVSQNIVSFRQEVDDNAPSVYQAMARTSKRLSVNFRFDQGSPRLDNKAYKDLERLVSYLNQPEHSDLNTYLVGFSDASSGQSQDLLLSRFRALAVRGALLEQGVIVSGNYGLGSFMPVASNSNQGSKLKNGRVEVWVTLKEARQPSQLIDEPDQISARRHF